MIPDQIMIWSLIVIWSFFDQITLALVIYYLISNTTKSVLRALVHFISVVTISGLLCYVLTFSNKHFKYSIWNSDNPDSVYVTLTFGFLTFWIRIIISKKAQFSFHLASDFLHFGYMPIFHHKITWKHISWHTECDENFRQFSDFWNIFFVILIF